MRRFGFAERLGWAPRRKGRGVIVWVRRGQEFDQVSALVAELASEHPRVNFLLVCESDCPDAPPGIRGVLTAPLGIDLVLALFLARTRPQVILLAEGAGGEALLRAAENHEIPVHGMRSDLARLKTELQASIVDASRKHARLSGQVLRAPGIARLSKRSLPPIADMASLAQALGHPKRILCLGNGPSSEAEEVRDLRAADFDAVFRVNHRWLDRGLFTGPDVVFAAGSKPVRRIAPPCIFCVQDQRRADKVRLACLHLRTGRSLVVAEDLEILDDWQQLELDGFGSFAPTNGTVMLSCARALAPRHITVAGVDLFSDALGAYPGDANTANAYGIFHNREKEREYVRRWIRLLSERDGVELHIIGKVLAEVGA